MTTRTHQAALAVAVLLGWAHAAVLAGWIVDDAAISFAYARNLADGAGLVATVGGERVEGYSNPLWVALLAGFELLGLASTTVAKPLIALTFAGSCGLAHRIAYRVRPDGFALIAPFFLASASTVAIWNASGLENALFTLLLLGGLALVQERRLGWAGLAFAGVALTRPEGALYGGVAGLWLLGVERRAAWRYWATLLGPVVAHQVFRYAYFAWPLPNTYYAKLGAPVDRWSLGARGWKQLLSWAHSTGVGWLVPVLVSAPAGRVLAGCVAAGALAGALWLPDTWRVGVFAGLGIAGPVFLGGPWLMRLTAHLAVIGLAFSVYAGGDWMRGYRWMSLVSGPLAVLLAAGVGVWADRADAWLQDGRVRWVAGFGVLGAFASAQLPLTLQFADDPVDYPEMIARRLAYTDAIADRIGLDRREVRTLEMDMGAHMLWSEYALVDLAGLVDVPIARHRFGDRAFWSRYLFEERDPHFAHLHRHWARVSGLTRFPQWERRYLHLPPYDDAGRAHDGVWLRRDLVLGEPPPDSLALSAGGLTVRRAELRSTRVGEHVVLDVWMTAEGESVPSFRVRVGPTAREEVPGMGLVAPAQWGEEAFRQRVVVTHGQAARELPVVIELGDERREIGTVEVVPDVPALLSELGAAAIGAAEEGRCDAAERGWSEAVAVSTGRSRPWAWEGAVREALSECFASSEPPSVEDLERARRWDAGAPGFLAVARPWAEARYADGLAARERGDADTAYRAFAEVLRVEPHRAWARRYAEEAWDAR